MTRHRKTSNLEEEKMGKYSAESEELLKLVGGKQNIAAVSHCVTRMRFVLNDPSKADVKGIEQMKVVKGTFTQAGQFQVIIGNTVAEFYQDFTNIAGIEGVSKEAVKQAAKQNQNVLQRMIAALAEIFAPLIPAIITGGLILGFRNCIDSMYLFENGTKTLCDISQFWSGVDSFLWLIGEAVFHMLPVGNKENGHHPDAGNRPWPYPGIWTAVKRLLCGDYAGIGDSLLGFRIFPCKYDRISGSGSAGNSGCLLSGLPGTVL